jgi:hypothetical protein
LKRTKKEQKKRANSDESGDCRQRLKVLENIRKQKTPGEKDKDIKLLTW